MKMYIEALFAEINNNPRQFFVGVCVFFVAIMGTSVHHVASTAFALLFLAGLSIVKDWRNIWRSLTNNEKWLLGGFALYALSAVISYINVQDDGEYIKEIERYFRFLLALPIYLYIKKYNIKVINYLFAGAVVSGPFLAYIAITDYLLDPTLPAQGNYHHIIFGSVAMLNVGVMLSVLLVMKLDNRIKILIAISIICGLIATLLSQSRGVWLVLPVYFVLALYYTLRHSRAFFAGLIILLVLVTGSLLLSPVGEMVEKRVDVAVDEVSSFYNENKYISSLGTRLAMWHVAIDVWKQHPFVGSGPGDFDNVILELQEDGKYVGMDVHSSTHNIYMQSLANTGLIGFVIMMASLFIIPFKVMFDSKQRSRCTFLVTVSSLVLFAVIGLSESWTLRLPIISVYIIYIMVFVSNNYSSDVDKSEPT